MKHPHVDCRSPAARILICAETPFGFLVMVEPSHCGGYLHPDAPEPPISSARRALVLALVFKAGNLQQPTAGIAALGQLSDFPALVTSWGCCLCSPPTHPPSAASPGSWCLLALGKGQWERRSCHLLAEANWKRVVRSTAATPVRSGRAGRQICRGVCGNVGGYNCVMLSGLRVFIHLEVLAQPCKK